MTKNNTITPSEELTRRLDNLDQIMQWHRLITVGRMAAEVFHDIRNPLTTAALHLETLRTTLTDKHLIKSATTAWESIQLIARYLDAHQHQLSNQVTRTRFNPAQEIRLATQALSSKTAHARVQIRTHLTRTRMLFGNQLKFYQIIHNLLSNAIDSYEKTEVQHPAIVVKLAPQENQLVLTVQDRGTGMAAAVQLHAFEPLYTTKTTAHDTGLGLALTKSAVELEFGGTIMLCSQPGYGTCFKVYFPQN